MTDFALVNPEDFAAALRRTPADSPPVIIETHFSSFDHPLVGDLPVAKHIPGAIQLHPSYLEAGTDKSRYYPNYQCPADGNVLPPDQLIEALQALGVTQDREVWIYGTEPDGIMAAARLIWGLMYAGIKTIRLLDGGLASWLAFGGPTVPSIPDAIEVAESRQSDSNRFPSWQVRPEYLATASEVGAIANSNSALNARLVDVRRSDEYQGTETRYYPFFSKAGHIPGAILQGNWINLVDEESRKVGPRLESVRRRWCDLGIVDDQVEKGETSLIFYCGTGWRSSLSFVVANLLGYHAKNFDDGFYGWSWDDDNEVAFGTSRSSAPITVVK
ncbi:MAG: rhodanese-like domain-containing protein [Verrucomicrobiota bacterium]